MATSSEPGSSRVEPEAANRKGWARVHPSRRATAAIESAAAAGKLLGQRLRDGHDRMAITQKMQQKLMSMFKESA